jgi:HEAT repeat protein
VSLTGQMRAKLAAVLRRERGGSGGATPTMARASTRRESLLREAAQSAGLGAVEESREGLAGWAGALRVRLERVFGPDGRGVRITVSGPAMPAGLTVRPEGLGTAIRSARGVREVEIGHDAFDAAAWIEGNATLARAVLDAGTRQSLRALFDGRLERPDRSPRWASGRLEDGVLRVDVPEVPYPSRGRGRGEDGQRGEEPGAFVYLSGLDHLGEILTLTIALAQRLATPRDLARRLADNLKSDPVAGVRLQLVNTLAREFPDDPTTRAALRTAREDPDAEVRLRAGIALGPEGRDVLLAIAAGEGAPDETMERAVAALGWHLLTGEALAILRNALRTRREGTARACLAALGHRRGPEVVQMLAKVMAVEKPELAAAAADALGATGEVSAEGALLSALGSTHATVRIAAVRSLGRVGTTAAVGPLRDAESDSRLRGAARQAIAEIQARHAGAERGQLSLAGGEAGQLSIAEEKRGALTLADGEAGRPRVGTDDSRLDSGHGASRAERPDPTTDSAR